MAMLVLDPYVEQRLIRKRRAWGIDRFDEVWDGVYVITEPKDNQHQELAGEIAAILRLRIVRQERGDVYIGINVSDRIEGWELNFRWPDVAVYLNDTSAVNCHSHWYGGPDFAVEITSPGDRTREKFEFYAKVKTRELLIVERDPWQLELYRLAGNDLAEVGRSTLDNSHVLTSEVLPLTWQLIAGESRPAIRIAREDGGDAWTV